MIRFRRITTENLLSSRHLKWARNRIPISFLKQQLALVSLVVASSLLLIITTFFSTDIEYEPIQRESTLKYGVIVDCGSSGSRAHIFKWQSDLKFTNVELVRDQATGVPLTKHITPGLSSMRDHPEKASSYLEPIMDFIKNTIPRDQHLETPIYFMATAGMRLLDESIRKKILTGIRRDLRAKYDFPKIKSQVITGEYEGIYSWLSLNMKGRIHNSTQGSDSYGMIEVGGASTQVTYELTPSVENSILEDLTSSDALAAFKSEQKTLNLGFGRPVKLFTTTFLGLGVNSAREAAIDLLVRDLINATGPPKKSELGEFEARLQDPCLTTGSSEIVLRPVELLESSEQSIGHTIKLQEATFKVHLEGTGNFLNCMDLLERILQVAKKEKLNCGPSRPCSMSLLGTNFIPFAHHQFIGLSELFFTTNEIMNAAGTFSRSKILHETQKICNTPYNVLLETHSQSGVSSEDRILYECFKAAWILNLLHTSGFRMPVDYKNLSSLNRMNGEEIDWTGGAIMAELALNLN